MGLHDLPREQPFVPGRIQRCIQAYRYSFREGRVAVYTFQGKVIGAGYMLREGSNAVSASRITRIGDSSYVRWTEEHVDKWNDNYDIDVSNGRTVPPWSEGLISAIIPLNEEQYFDEEGLTQ